MASSATSNPGEIKLDRPIGLLGGIALVIGGVIGMGIYVLIAVVGARTGTTLWLPFTLAIFVSAVGVLPIIHISSALPRAGAGYLYSSRLLNPLLGAITSFWAILGGASVTAVVSLGMSGYISPYLPWEVPVRLIAVALLLAFFLLYRFGLRLATWLQMILALQLVLALLVYAVAGTAEYDLKFTLNLPRGAGGLIVASILCYSACMGFQVIAEMGEEIVDASRNIPLSLLIGGLAILIIYITVGMVFISAVPYDFESLMAMKAPLMTTGEKFLPGYLVAFLSLGALSAGLTSFNAAAIALPRELFALARDGVVPGFLGRIHAGTRSPLNAVGAFFLFTILIILAGGDIDFYGVMAAVGILLMTVMIAFAALRLSSRFPDRIAHAYFHMPRPWLIPAVIVAVISSLGFTVLVLMEVPVVALIYAVWTLLVVVYHVFRIRWLKRTGFPWNETVAVIPGFDEDDT
ncbi:MAG: APC family permease [Proteobacteria bacterium]|nr:APC family permease [Pseudomonadota bacterium]